MKASINALHHQQTDSLRELEFYNTELAILHKRLEEVTVKNTATETLAQVEHFQNRFIILHQQYNELRKENTERLQIVNEMAKVRPNHIEEKMITDKGETIGRMHDFVTSFQNTRLEFNKFLSKVM
jgi:hypothetical protein